MLLKSQSRSEEAFVDGVLIRRGRPEDAWGVHEAHQYAIHGYVQELGLAPKEEPLSAAKIKEAWHTGRSMDLYLNRIYDQFWVAEQHGNIVGIARSILIDDVQELTEFFVHPNNQVKGVGQALLERAFPKIEAKYRCIIATLNSNAQALYLRAGVYPRYPNGLFGRAPEQLPVTSSLAMVPMNDSSETLNILAAIDSEIVDHRRDSHHRFLMSDRQGFLYLRAGQAVGYGYVGTKSGPFALLDGADYADALTAAESKAASMGLLRFNLVVPLLNQAAVEHLLGRGYRMDPFHTRFMTDKQVGNFANYIGTSPMNFL